MALLTPGFLDDYSASHSDLPGNVAHGSRARGQEIDEYQVKAAFLYNFAKFVDWPSQTFKTPQDPIVVCVLGPNPFGSSLEAVIRGKSIDGRAFSFRQVENAGEADTCQILFVRFLGGKTLSLPVRKPETSRDFDGGRELRASPRAGA